MKVKDLITKVSRFKSCLLLLYAFIISKHLNRLKITLQAETEFKEFLNCKNKHSDSEVKILCEGLLC